MRIILHTLERKEFSRQLKIQYQQGDKTKNAKLSRATVQPLHLNNWLVEKFPKI